MVTKVRTKIDVDLEKFTDEVAVLIPDLISKNDFQKKIRAKNSLINMGKSVLPQLNLLLKSENYQLRILVAKIVQQIGAEESICTLIKLIKEDDSSISWVAAKGLIIVGRDSIVPLLKEIVKRNKSYYLKSLSHYVLVNLFSIEEKNEFKALLMSLSNNNFTSFLAPIEAAKALKIYQSKNKLQQGLI